MARVTLTPAGGVTASAGLVAPVATRTSWLNGLLSNGTDKGGTFIFKHKAACACSDIQVEYANWGSLGPGANDITVRAAIQGPDGVFSPLFFNGKRDAVINPGGNARCDPLGIDFALGDVFKTRTFVSVASTGMTWQYGMSTLNDGVEGNNRSATPVDATTSGSVTTLADVGYHPTRILGIQRSPAARFSPVLGLIGDSILADSNSFGLQAVNAHPTATGNPTGTYVQASVGGSVTISVVGNGGNAAPLRQLLSGSSHIICEYPVNDINGAVDSLATIQSRVSSVWNAWASRGVPVYQTTCTPHATITATPAKESIRQAFNAWVRTKPAPLTNYIEVADVVETARNSGLWKPAYDSGDSIHPNTAGHTAIAAVVKSTLGI